MSQQKSVMGNFRRAELLEKVLKDLEQKESEIIEIVGVSGSGKSHLYASVCQELRNRKIPFIDFYAYVFKFTHIMDMIKLLSGVGEKEVTEYAEEAKAIGIDMKYDFFFYLSTKLSEKKVFKSQIIIIDNFELLDQYTIDFIQYIVGYERIIGIKFLIFTKKESFLFSHKHKLEFLNYDEINTILDEFLDHNENDIDTLSEILKNITGGNIFILETILERFRDSGSTKLDLSDYLDSKLNAEVIFSEKISNLKEDFKRVLISIYLLEDKANIQNITTLLQKENISEIIAYLTTHAIICEKSGFYQICKRIGFHDLALKDMDSLVSKTMKILLKNTELISGACKVKYFYLFGLYEESVFSELIVYLELLNDHENLQLLYNFIIERTENPKKKAGYFEKLGNVYEKLNKIEAAAEVFRQSLKLGTENAMPIVEVVYKLANNLNSINSPSFALEIIKKYSPQSLDIYWKCRLLLLKANIMIDMEQIDEAYDVIDKSFDTIGEIKDNHNRILVMAERKKILAKIFYYLNQFDKAETNYYDAEKLYRSIDDFSGLAAIYNNIGILMEALGEWKEAEKLYLKSLEYEKKRFNLNGYSVCYINLGALMSDMGDHTKALQYLNEALNIQSLFNDRYKITFIYNNIGVTCMENAMYKESEHAFKQVLEISLTFNLYKNIVASYYHLGALNFKTGKWKKAIEYYEQAIAKSEENNFLEGLCKAYNNLGELYEKRGEFNLAYDLYFKGLEIIPDVKDELMRAELYGNLGSVLTHLHKYGEAYPYLVESYDYFKVLHAKEKIIEANQKYAQYFIQTRNFESANYYINSAIALSKEINNDYELGRAYYIRSFLSVNNRDQAKKDLKFAIEQFVKTKNNFELAMANYQYALVLSEDEEEWEQALEILNENKKIVKEFDSISLLEKNDYLINKITKEHSIELKESKYHESLLNKFYEITEKLNIINDFDHLLNASLDQLVEISESDGGLLCLYNNHNANHNWEYKIFKGFNEDDEDYDSIIDIVQESYDNNKIINHQQPHFAPQFNNLVTFPLRIRNKSQGVILLYCKHGSHYFTKKIINLISALCNQIIVTIENLRQSNLEKSHAIIREELMSSSSFTNIIGKSPQIEEIFKIIDKIKDAPTTVLIEGPSGTGKELIARAIHFNSNRKNKKFVAQYCGALPETLLESELFGHVKGAFTGAAYDKKGLFEIADGGSFFLDEIADISLSTQAKILRFLQEGEIKRVGSTKTTTVDVRVICATNVSLKDKVEKGEFRLDLYYRLNVIRIDVPSLKERKSDIPLLAIHFLDKYNKKINKVIKGITDEAMKYLNRCDWPGNIRQLENEVERAVTLAENNSFIRPSDLSEEVFKLSDHKETINLLENTSLKDAVERLEKKLISNALERNNHNQTRAAKDLGLSRQGLIKKLKRYGFERIDES